MVLSHAIFCAPGHDARGPSPLHVVPSAEFVDLRPTVRDRVPLPPRVWLAGSVGRKGVLEAVGPGMTRGVPRSVPASDGVPLAGVQAALPGRGSRGRGRPEWPSETPGRAPRLGCGPVP